MSLPDVLAECFEVVLVETQIIVVADLGVQQGRAEGRKAAIGLGDRSPHVVAERPDLWNQPADAEPIGLFLVGLTLAIDALELAPAGQRGSGREGGHDRHVVGQRLVEQAFGLGHRFGIGGRDRFTRFPNLPIIGPHAQHVVEADLFESAHFLAHFLRNPRCPT